MPLPILVTGAAGFIGFHVARRLLADGHEVVGVDRIGPHGNLELKRDRLAQIEGEERFRFAQIDLADRRATASLFAEAAFDRVIHLAAQTGVRASLDHPDAYIDSNLVGFANVLEGCRRAEVGHLVFASSSSVYGANTQTPYSTHQHADHPVSLYGATKKSNELMAHSYAHLYGLPVTGLRFFTVYGPWGRPDMAYFLFTRAILEGEPIEVFNQGEMKRDFTYIDDVVEGIVRAMSRPPTPDAAWNGDAPDPATSSAPYRIYNIGNNEPVPLMSFIETIEEALGREAEKEFLPLQPGDLPLTCADIDDLADATGFRPSTPLRRGIERFVSWYCTYYGNGTLS